MSGDEVIECGKHLTELFPKADMSEQELQLFLDAITPYRKADAIRVLGQHRLACEFARPRFNVILNELRKCGAQRDVVNLKPSKSVIAASMIQDNPAFAGRPEAELILRYHRKWFFSYRKRVVGEDVKPVDVARVEAARKFHKQSCKRDLVAIGLSPSDAADLSQWIDAARADFDMVVDGLEAKEKGLV